MSQLDRTKVTRFLSPGRRLSFAWHTATDEVWSATAPAAYDPGRAAGG